MTNPAVSMKRDCVRIVSRSEESGAALACCDTPRSYCASPNE